MSRTITLAEGHEKCDFWFKKGEKTNMVMPQSLNHLNKSNMA